MSRSIWKGPNVETSCLKSKSKKLWSRKSIVLPQFVGQTFEIYNGKFFLRVTITEQMIGHKFGEFASTRRKAIHKQKSK